jgi:hypothetical protein
VPLETALFPQVEILPGDDFRGYTGNRVSPFTFRSWGVFPQRFTIEIPAVDPAERDNIEHEQTANYSVGLNLSSLNINIG